MVPHYSAIYSSQGQPIYPIDKIQRLASIKTFMVFRDKGVVVFKEGE
jgi:hypothetical protein